MRNFCFSRFCLLMLAIVVAFFATGCGGGGGGGGGVAGPAATGSGTVSGSVSTSSLTGNIRANTFDLANPAANVDVEIGYYDANETFVAIKGGTTDAKGQYTFTGIPDNVKNLIIRAKVGNETYEAVLPEVVANGTVKAPVVDPDTVVTAMIVREAAKQMQSDKINMAEILSKIPPSTLKGMKNQAAEIVKIANAFVEREKALDAAAATIGQDKLNQLRQFGFEQSRKIIAGIEEGLYSREDGWQLFDRAMALQIETLGLTADALLLIQQIDQKHIHTDIANNVNLGTHATEFKRRGEERRVTEVIDKLIRAFKYFSDNSVVTAAEYNFVKDALDNVKREVSNATNAGAIMTVLEPAMPRIGSVIDKIMQGVGLVPSMNNPPAPGQMPPIAAVFEAMVPPTGTGPLTPEHMTSMNAAVLAALRNALPNASAEMIDHLLTVIQGPVVGLGGDRPAMPQGGGNTPPSFGGGAATTVVGQVKELSADLKTGDYVYGIFPPEDRGTMPIARLKVKQGVAVTLASYNEKWVECEGTFDPKLTPPGFEVSKVKNLTLEEIKALSNPQGREMGFSGPFNKTSAGVYYIGPSGDDAISAGGRIQMLEVTNPEAYVGKWVNLKGYVTEWATSGAVPVKVKVTEIAINNSFTASN